MPALLGNAGGGLPVPDQKMRYPKGQSGNPDGRPKGIVDRRLRFRKRLEECGDEILTAAIQQALDGDSGLLRALLDRLIPPYRPEAAPAQIPVSSDYSLLELGSITLTEVLNGRLPPDTARAFITMLAQQQEMMMLTDIEQRLAALESGAQAD